MPSLEDGTLVESKNLTRRIHDYCEERRDKMKQKWEMHKMTLNSIKRKKKSSINNKARKREMQLLCRAVRGKELKNTLYLILI